MVHLRAIWSGLAITLIFSLSCAARAADAPPPPAATVISIDGKGLAKLRRKSGIESSLALLQRLNPGDKITTDDKTVAQLSLPDGTLVRVGINTEYRIESMRAQGSFVAWVFNLARGSIRAIVEKNTPRAETKFRVNTPAGTMGVRGTEFVISHDEKTNVTTLYTLEGKVGFGAPKCEAEKNCIDVKEGEMASIGVGAKKPEAAKPFKLEEMLMQSFAELKKEAEKTGEKAEGKNGELFRDDTAAGRVSVMLGTSELGSNVGLLDDTAIKKAAADAAVEMQRLQDNLLGRDAATREAMTKALRDGTLADRLALGAAVNKGVDKNEEAVSPIGAGATAVKNFKAAQQYQDIKNIEQKSGGKILGSNEEADKQLAKLMAKLQSQTDHGQSGGQAKISSTQSADFTMEIIRDAGERLKAMVKAREEARAAGKTDLADSLDKQINDTIGAANNPGGAQGQDHTSAGTTTDTTTNTTTNTKTKTTTRNNCGPEADEAICRSRPPCSTYHASCGYYNDAWDAQCLRCDMATSRKLRSKADELARSEYTSIGNVIRNTISAVRSAVTGSARKCYKTERVCELKMIPCDLSKGRQCSARYENKCSDKQVETPCR